MAKGFFHLVLHSHLPYVLYHGTWPHGEVWLQEAASDCYLTILESCYNAIASGAEVKLTVSLTPILLEQLNSDYFLRELERYLQQRIDSAVEEEKYYKDKQPERSYLARFWARHYMKKIALLDSINGDIISGFLRLASTDKLEIISSCATHGYLPLLGWDECVRVQVRTGLDTSRKILGFYPKGFWLPECAYRPSYLWESPITGEKRQRRGVEEVLHDEGVYFSYVDHHLLTGQPKVGSYMGGRLGDGTKLWEKVQVEDERYKNAALGEPYQPYYVVSPGKDVGITFFVRDPMCSEQVWSRDIGYPGDGRYLEFHKRAFPSGHRYWRVTDRRVGLGEKKMYVPKDAEEAVLEHAKHFVELLENKAIEFYERYNKEALIVAIFDAELFGHWWHEGGRWLTEVWKLLSKSNIVKPVSGSYAMEVCGSELPIVHLWEGSWGAGGDHRVWFNEETKWMWEKIYECESKVVNYWSLQVPSDKLVERVFHQLAVELLLLESSDWEFLYTTWQARDYAEQRFNRHYNRFKELDAMAEVLQKGGSLTSEQLRRLEHYEKTDSVFDGVMPSLWRD